MSSLHALVLMPVYNHLQRSTETAVQCFLEESHPSKTLLIGDDRPFPGQLSQEDVQIPNVVLYQMATRANNLAAKYSSMVEFADRMGIQYDFVSIAEDDDLILPWRLEQSAAAFEKGASWVYYDFVYVSLGAGTERWASSNMFWSGISISKWALEKIGGFGDCPKMGFDQLILTKLFDTVGEPARIGPSLVYRADESDPYHTSALSSGFSDTSWWDKTKPCPKTGKLVPGLDKWAVDSINAVHVDMAKRAPK